MFDYRYGKKTYMIAMFLVLVAGLNDGLMSIFGFSPLRSLSNRLNPNLHRLIALIIGIASLSLFFCKWVYTPFKGPTLFPTGLLSLSTPSDWTVERIVNTIPNTKVIYWASEPDENPNEIATLHQAYGSFTNGGVTMSDKNGKALIRVRNPQDYTIGDNIKPAHVHYRCVKKDGWIGAFRTIKI
tara:strand:+ start:11703 stop:12254 length:552 start_codon:yes stop_codon:yes gene_type:complete